MKKDVYTIPEVAQILKLSRHTVFQWVKKGYLKAYRPAINAAWKVTREEVLRYMKEHDIPMEFLNGDKIKILVVDDEVSLTQLIKKALQNTKKFQIEIANSGFIAGAKLESFKPDVIILDIYLGDMDGREFFDHIQNHPELNEIRVIGITGKLSQDEIQPLLDKGFSAFLLKPFKMNKLKETILDVVEK